MDGPIVARSSTSCTGVPAGHRDRIVRGVCISMTGAAAADLTAIATQFADPDGAELGAGADVTGSGAGAGSGDPAPARSAPSGA